MEEFKRLILTLFIFMVKEDDHYFVAVLKLEQLEL